MKKTIRLKLKSKKGVTLIELLVGITIVVIVFASTLGAMVGGFTTTVRNSDENRASVLNASVNEIIFNCVRKMRISEYDDAVDFIDELETAASSSGGMGDDNYAYALASAIQISLKSPVITDDIPDVQFVKAEFNSETGKYDAAFPEGVSYQYTLIPEQKKQLATLTGAGSAYEMDGLTIKTCFESAGGPIIYESFVPFYK